MARYLTHEQIPDELDFASIDVSFISLKLILPAVANVLKDGGYVASLVKPQFEAGREKVGKKGSCPGPGSAQGGAGALSGAAQGEAGSVFWD